MNLSNDLTVAKAALRFSGYITVGGTSPKYGTLVSAVNDLNTYGVCGPTTILIRPGTYTGGFILNIPNTNSTNTVTFRPDWFNAGKVKIQFDGSTNNYVARFNNTNNITLKT